MPGDEYADGTPLRCRLFGHRWEDMSRVGLRWDICTRCNAGHPDKLREASK